MARFVQITKDQCLIDISISGIQPSGIHALIINTYGNIEHGWKSTGNPFGLNNMEQSISHRLESILGNITVDLHGVGNFLVENHPLKISDIIGRSLVLYENPINETLLPTALVYSSMKELGEGLLAGVIAKSAGAFENRKRVCSCSGQTLWQEMLPMNV